MTQPASRHVQRRVRRALIATVVIVLPVAIHSLWDLVEATLLARRIHAIALRNEPVSLESLRYRLPNSDQRRAARLYASAADLAAWRIHERWENGDVTRIDTVVERAFGSGKPVPALDDLHRRFVEGEPALTLLDEASRLDFSGFSSIAPSLQETSWPLLDLNALNCLRVDVLTARGDAVGAADALAESVKLQRTLSGEFSRHDARRRLYRSLQFLLQYADPDAATLSRLQQAFEQLPDQDDLAEQLRFQRARLLGIYWPYAIGDQAWTLRPVLMTRGFLDSAISWLARPLVMRYMRHELDPFDEAIAVARQGWPAKLEEDRQLVSRYLGDLQNRRPAAVTQGMRWWLLRITRGLGVRTLDWALPSAGRDLTMRRTSIVALAIERFRRAHGGVAPGTLAALVPEYLREIPADPFSGRPLLYRLDPDAYTVYSVDVDRTDNGGAVGGGALDSMPRTNKSQSRDFGIRVPLNAATLTSRRHP